jgi:hemerythrin
MEWIGWDSELELGHAAMDADHKELVALVNLLADGVVNHRGRETYDQLLKDLLANVEAHFGREDALMALHHYPFADEHKSQHAKLIQSAREFSSQFDATAAPSVSLLYFFEQWLIRHILSTDRELADFLAAAK